MPGAMLAGLRQLRPQGAASCPGAPGHGHLEGAAGPPMCFPENVIGGRGLANRDRISRNEKPAFHRRTVRLGNAFCKSATPASVTGHWSRLTFFRFFRFFRRASRASVISV